MQNKYAVVVRAINLLAGLCLCAIFYAAPSLAQAPSTRDFHLPPKTYYRTASVQGHTIFYREAGDPKKPTLVLLHGFPTSSHYYRELIPLLSRHMHIIAPDNLGSGFSEHPDPDTYTYTFEKLTDHVDGLLEALKIDRYMLYVTDFGANVGFRLVTRHPERVQAIISQNGNAYVEGLTQQRLTAIRERYEDRSPQKVASIYQNFPLSKEGFAERQYFRDVPVERRDTMSPDRWTHDLAFLESDKDKKIQVQLLQDFQTNVDQYPKIQETMRQRQFPTLLVWAERDFLFPPAGAKAFLRDLPKAELHFLDAGHSALEEKPTEIAQYILEFISKL